MVKNMTFLQSVQQTAGLRNLSFRVHQGEAHPKSKGFTSYITSWTMQSRTEVVTGESPAAAVATSPTSQYRALAVICKSSGQCRNPALCTSPGGEGKRRGHESVGRSGDRHPELWRGSSCAL